MNKWVNEQLKDFIRSTGYGEEVEECLHRGTSCLAGNLVVRVNFPKRSVIISNTSERKKHKYGKAICRKGELFNARFGFALAWARYKGEELPDDIFCYEVGELPVGTEVKVHRWSETRTILAHQKNMPRTILEAEDGTIIRISSDTGVLLA